MNNNLKTVLMKYGSFIVITGMFVSSVPITIGYIAFALLFGKLGLVYFREGKLDLSIQILALSGLFLTIASSRFTSYSLYNVTVLFFIVAVLGGINQIFKQIRKF